MKYVTLNADNTPAAFYDPALNAIPAGAIAISATLWKQWIASPTPLAYQPATQTLAAAPVLLAVLQSQVVAATQAAVAAVVAAIYPTSAAQAALQNAAIIVLQAGNAAPASTSPFYVSFNALAAQYGQSPAAFAALVVVATTQSLALNQAEGALAQAVAAAPTAALLATALAAFEAALAAVVAALNAALPTPLTAPAAISIAGVNA